MTAALPYKIAVLCYLFDVEGRVLLLRRSKPPNQHLDSPIGGKLHLDEGESPTACALREIHEEVGLNLDPARLHLTGIVSETAYAGQTHWLMFLYEVTGPVKVERSTFEEGTLIWHEAGAVAKLNIPETDRYIIWPLFWRYRGRFFAVHIDCRHGGLRWRLEQPVSDAGDWQQVS